MFFVICSLPFFLFSCDGIEQDSGDESIRVFYSEEFLNEINNVPFGKKWAFIHEFTSRKYHKDNKIDSLLNIQIQTILRFEKPTNTKNLLLILNNSELAGFSSSILTISEYILNAFNAGTNSDLRCRAAIYLAFHNMNNRDLEKLNFYLEVLTKELHSVNNDFIFTAYYSLRGDYYDILGDYFLAVTNYHKALQYVTEKDKYNLGTLYHNLANIYIGMEHYEKAGYYTDQFAIVFGEDQIPFEYQITQAVSRTHLGNYVEAEAIYNLLLLKLDVKENTSLAAQILSNRGNLLRLQGRFDLAMRDIEVSDSLCVLFGFEFGHLINQLNKAEIFFDKKNYSKVLTDLNAVFPLIENSENNTLKRNLYKLLYLSYDSIGSFDLANVFFRKFVEQKNAYIGDLPRSYITEWLLNEENKIRLENDYQLNIQIKKRSKERLVLSLVFLLLLSLLGFLYYRSQRNVLLDKIQLNTIKQELELQEKELMSKTLKGVSINNFKSSLILNLESLVHQLPTNQQLIFEPLLTDLSRNSRSNNFKEFDLSFTNVYENFYDSLRKISPNLTSSEIRICAFIKLNFSTKDICEITNRSQGTIENIRVSIRKKLNLRFDENLHQFLNRF